MFEIDSPFTMVAIIVVVGVLGGTINNWINKRSEKSDANDTVEMDTLRREVRDLSQRVRTLEKIVTDQESQLNREINRL